MVFQARIDYSCCSGRIYISPLGYNDGKFHKGMSVKVYKNWIGCLIACFNKAVKIRFDSREVYVNKNSLLQNYHRFEHSLSQIPEGQEQPLLALMNDKYINFKEKVTYNKNEIKTIETKLKQLFKDHSYLECLGLIKRPPLPQQTVKTPSVPASKVKSVKKPVQKTVPNPAPKVISQPTFKEAFAEFETRIKEDFDHLENPKSITNIINKINKKFDHLEHFEKTKIKDWSAYFMEVVARIPLDKLKIDEKVYQELQGKLIPKLKNAIDNDIKHVVILLQLMDKMESYSEMADYIQKNAKALAEVKIEKAAEYFHKIARLHAPSLPVAVGLEEAQEKIMDYSSFKYLEALKFLYNKDPEKLNDAKITCADGKTFNINKILLLAHSEELRVAHSADKEGKEIVMNGSLQQWEEILKIITGKSTLFELINQNIDLSFLTIIHGYFPKFLKSDKADILIDEHNFIKVWSYVRNNSVFPDLKLKCRLFLLLHFNSKTVVEQVTHFITGWDKLSLPLREELQTAIFNEASELCSLNEKLLICNDSFKPLSNKGSGIGLGNGDDLKLALDNIPQNTESFCAFIKKMELNHLEINGDFHNRLHVKKTNCSSLINLVKALDQQPKKIHITITCEIHPTALKIILEFINKNKKIKLTLLKLNQIKDHTTQLALAECISLLEAMAKEDDTIKERVCIKNIYENGVFLSTQTAKNAHR